MKKENMKKKSKADWDRIKAMRDGDIDYSDIPQLDDNFFANAIIWKPRKKQLTIRIDADVYDFFKSLGTKYQTRMNAVLRRYMELTQGEPRSKAP
jgi:uncharacterized protein (DUF4415 family)